MSSTIESQDIPFGKFYEDYYAVPDYQREYVWERPHVEQLLNDIYDEFSDSETWPQDQKPEYFVGSIVVCPSTRHDQQFDLIDGQQRTTTTYIFLNALRDRLISLGEQPMSDLVSKISSKSTNFNGEEVDRYRLELQYEDSKDVLVDIANRIEHAADIVTGDTKSSTNIKNAYSTTLGFFQEKFASDGSRLKRFYAYFIHKVKIIRIKTGSVNKALKIFETINDRGRALDAMDLLKNLMFMSSSQEQFIKLKESWKDLTDKLYNAGEKPLRFLRYFIFSSYEVDQLREEDIYEWLSKNETLCGYKKNAIGFVSELLDAATAYSNFMAGNDTGGAYNRYIDNIRLLSGSARQHFVLLLAGRKLPLDAFSLLSKHLENLLFAYIITRESTKEFERLFARWAKDVREAESYSDIEEFVAKSITPTKNALAGRFNYSFESMEYYSIQFYRLRYVLGKITQYLNETAFGSEGDKHKLSTFINRQIDIEHILSQSLSEEVVKEFDNREDVDYDKKLSSAQEMVPKLGNLTLVEKTLNSSLGCKPFSIKREVYDKSQYLITKSIYDNAKIGKNSAYDKVIVTLEKYETWSKETVLRRQELLAALAHKVWDIPYVGGVPGTTE
jgi:uncharacterized protein with ParB-like and HNH nuclease domain